MASAVSREVSIQTVRDLLASLVIKTTQSLPDAYIVSLVGPNLDRDGNPELFAEISADRNGDVEYPTVEQTERSAFKITLSNCPAAQLSFPFQYGQRLHGKILIDIEEECFARILDKLKELLPRDAVLFRQVAGGTHPLYGRLGFTIKSHDFSHMSYWPRGGAYDITLALADWGNNKPSAAGDKRSHPLEVDDDDDEDDNAPAAAASKKVKP
jgi:hypothetical protein